MNRLQNTLHVPHPPRIHSSNWDELPKRKEDSWFDKKKWKENGRKKIIVKATLTTLAHSINQTGGKKMSFHSQSYSRSFSTVNNQVTQDVVNMSAQHGNDWKSITADLTSRPIRAVVREHTVPLPAGISQVLIRRLTAPSLSTLSNGMQDLSTVDSEEEDSSSSEEDEEQQDLQEDLDQPDQEQTQEYAHDRLTDVDRRPSFYLLQ
jgi:hypothetical protein